jgi:hypothetical protein
MLSKDAAWIAEGQRASMYRVTGDFHAHKNYLLAGHAFIFGNISKLVGLNQTWPDADMMDLGVNSDFHGTPAAELHAAIWTMARSPLMYSGPLPAPKSTMNLIANPLALDIHAHSGNMKVRYQGDCSCTPVPSESEFACAPLNPLGTESCVAIWESDMPNSECRAMAILNLGNHSSVFSMKGLQNLTNIYAGTASHHFAYRTVVPGQGARLLMLSSGPAEDCVTATAAAAKSDDEVVRLPGPMPLSLRDHAIASGVVPTYLDGRWVATNPASTPNPVPAMVPGDIMTDLQRAGLQPDPYFNSTWQEPSFIAGWNTGLWVYTKQFTSQLQEPSASDQLLVFEGIRMGAMIALNGHFLGNATNQFQRYSFPVSSLLKNAGEENFLSVTFGMELNIDCGGRYTYSSEIDWAPTMLTHDTTSGSLSHAAPERPTASLNLRVRHLEVCLSALSANWVSARRLIGPSDHTADAAYVLCWWSPYNYAYGQNPQGFPCQNHGRVVHISSRRVGCAHSGG